ncbi:hypothetical protein KR059_000219, partial [Drosophila kikkawai]
IRPHEAVNLFLDSQAAIRSMQSSAVSSKNVQASREPLDSLSSTKSVRIYWVPSHQGIDGSETADELAKEGVGLESERAENVPVSLRTLQSEQERRAKSRYLGSPVLSSLEDGSRRKSGELLAFAKNTLIFKDLE